MLNPPENFTQKKLSLLYIMRQSRMSLTEEELTQICIALDLYNFFDLALQLAEFVDNGLLELRHAAAQKIYTLTEKGGRTIDIFLQRIPSFRREELEEYIEQNRAALKRAMHFHAVLSRISDTEYKVELTTIEYGAEVMHMTLSVGTNEMAQRILMNWENQNESLYDIIMEKLLLGKSSEL